VDADRGAAGHGTPPVPQRSVKRTNRVPNAYESRTRTATAPRSVRPVRAGQRLRRRCCARPGHGAAAQNCRSTGREAASSDLPSVGQNMDSCAGSVVCWFTVDGQPVTPPIRQSPSDLSQVRQREAASRPAGLPAAGMCRPGRSSAHRVMMKWSARSATRLPHRFANSGSTQDTRQSRIAGSTARRRGREGLLSTKASATQGDLRLLRSPYGGWPTNPSAAWRLPQQPMATGL
jgi:hypothetical protein